VPDMISNLLYKWYAYILLGLYCFNIRYYL